MATSLNGYSVNIIADDVHHIVKNGHNYYAMAHLSEYKIELTNNHPTRCNANVSVDGESIGTWRVESNSKIIIGRPANLNRVLVFVEDKSGLAKKAGIDSSNYNSNGVVSVKFTPEQMKQWPFSVNAYMSTPTFYNPGSLEYQDVGTNEGVNTRGNNAMVSKDLIWTPSAAQYYQHSTGSIPQMMSNNNTSFAAGASALGRGSDEYFNEAEPLTSVDKKNITTINVRLIALPDQYVSIREAMRLNKQPRVSETVYQINSRMFNNDEIYMEKPYTDRSPGLYHPYKTK